MKNLIKKIAIPFIAMIMLVSSLIPAFASDFYFKSKIGGFSYQSQYDIDIGLFSPGDTYQKVISTDNQTDYKIYYQITDVKNNISSSDMFNVIDLKIKDQDEKILFNGKLKDAETDKILVEQNSKDLLTYEFYFPVSLGNELQGKELDCTIYYYAETGKTNSGFYEPNFDGRDPSYGRPDDDGKTDEPVTDPSDPVTDPTDPDDTDNPAVDPDRPGTDPSDPGKTDDNETSDPENKPSDDGSGISKPVTDDTAQVIIGDDGHLVFGEDAQVFVDEDGNIIVKVFVEKDIFIKDLSWILLLIILIVLLFKTVYDVLKKDKDKQDQDDEWLDDDYVDPDDTDIVVKDQDKDE